MEENYLVVEPRKFQSLLAGCKTYTIRRGHRTFNKNIRISNTVNPVRLSGIVNSYVHTILAEVPIRVLESESFSSFQECLDALRVYYPDMAWNSPVTVVEFRIAI